jgi:hypothetical protein
MTYQAETTLHTVASRLAIGDLCTRYGRAYDTGDLAEFVGCFTQEAIFELPDGQVVEGHKGIVDFFRAAPHDMVHVTTDAVTEVDGVRARQTAHAVVYQAGDDGVPVARFVGTYRDELIYERGAWYFTKRSIIRDL